MIINNISNLIYESKWQEIVKTGGEVYKNYHQNQERKTYQTSSLENTPPLPPSENASPFVRALYVMQSAARDFLNPLRDKIDDILGQGNGNIIIGVAIQLLLASPIIYFIFIRPILKSVEYKYGLKSLAMDLLFIMYYDIWTSDKIKDQIYQGNYENYKKIIFQHYIELYDAIQLLSNDKKTRFLDDIKSGFIRRKFLEVISRKLGGIPLRDDNIDDIIYTIFISTKLTKSQFITLLKL